MMKHLVPFCLIVAVVTGCATVKYGEFTPKSVPQPSSVTFSTYTAAMKHYDGFQTSSEWQNDHKDEIRSATRPEVLSKFVESDAAADALLAKISTCYEGDPLVLTQISAITQMVMRSDCSEAPSRRKLWIAALKRTRNSTDDGYVRTFCDQQLRICELN